MFIWESASVHWGSNALLVVDNQPRHLHDICSQLQGLRELFDSCWCKRIAARNIEIGEGGNKSSADH